MQLPATYRLDTYAEREDEELLLELTGRGNRRSIATGLRRESEL